MTRRELGMTGPGKGLTMTEFEQGLNDQKHKNRLFAQILSSPLNPPFPLKLLIKMEI
jgi:hypothetical protein